jgi:hypothetical protein
MNRRQLLQGFTALPAAGLLRAQQPVVPPKPTPAAIDEIPVIESTIPDITAAPLHRYFDKDQFDALRRLSDVIVPAAGGVPGALAAGAPEFLDFLISKSPEPRQKLYRAGLDDLNRNSKERFNVPFAETTQAQADALLSPLRQQWTAAASDEGLVFLRTSKEDILLATENSREWIKVVSKRIRGASGTGAYWRTID